MPSPIWRAQERPVLLLGPGTGPRRVGRVGGINLLRGYLGLLERGRP